MSHCIFCELHAEQYIEGNDLAYAIWDNYPVSPLHCLIIPKEHVEDYFELTRDEIVACDELLCDMQSKILDQDSSVKGFNIGMNCGKVAGQSIFHCHIHLIPRREKDVENPRGGVRHVISGKGYY